ncbi:hypothetical protein EJD97_006339 [Solanum chilense]|uniref:F-box domain-containing protein n=1 Tax=Solanum chilense TaxID=4083 RepID=A0A6N2AJ05_SOLCI|nr:hypothetical protein EJD97_006339 [Solanum chilense]
MPTKAISFCLLPSELIQYIILQLSLPEIIQLKSVNKSILSIISDGDFVRNYNHQSSSATWLFLYKKRWRREALLYGISDCSNRWFTILICDMLKQVVPPGEDVYFLTANANIFLFALNNTQQLMSLDIMTRVVKNIPPSPLGPRGTSSWRRSDEVVSQDYNFDDEYIFLSASNGRNGSVIIGVVRPHECCNTTTITTNTPLVIRPTFNNEQEHQHHRLAVGFSWGNSIDLLHVYGDGNMMTIRSDKVNNNSNKRKIKRIELWGLSRNNGRYWEFVSVAPNELIHKISKPYGAMMGCMQKSKGVTRAILMTNLEGTWETIWLSYNNNNNHWAWLPLPDCNMKGSNLAGVTFSSGLTLS